MTEEQFLEITGWQNETFPLATVTSKIHHLKQEIEELENEIANDGINKDSEFADCFLLLFGAANKAGMDYEDICSAIEVKMYINKQRQWGKPDKNGVVNHKK